MKTHVRFYIKVRAIQQVLSCKNRNEPSVALPLM